MLRRVTTTTTFRADEVRRFEFEINDTRPLGSLFDLELIITNSSGAEVVHTTVSNLSVPAGGRVSVVTDPTMTILEPGKNYTLRARIIPPPGEGIVGNNSVNAAFTILQANAGETISVPDSPAWISILALLIVGAWLCLSVRKKEN